MMPRLNTEQYSYLRQSLRHMPPTNLPAPKDDARNQGIVSDFLHGKSIRNLTRRMGKKKKHTEGIGIQDKRMGDHGGSSTYASRTSDMNPDSRDYSIQYSSLSEEPLDHQQQEVDRVPRNVAYHEPAHYETARQDRGNYYGGDFRSGTVGVDYANRFCTPTFDHEYTGQYERNDVDDRLPYIQQPQTLRTLQQYVEEKMDSYHVDLGPEKPPPPREPSEHSIDIPSLLDDIIRSTREMGDGVSVTEVLHEMGLKDKLQKMLPEWAGDVLEAPEEDLDPAVLKELVLSTVEESTSSNEAKLSGDDRKMPPIHTQQPAGEDEALQHLVDEIKKRPSNNFAELEVEKFARLLSGKNDVGYDLLADDVIAAAEPYPQWPAKVDIAPVEDHPWRPHEKSKAVQLAVHKIRPTRPAAVDETKEKRSAKEDGSVENDKAIQLAVGAMKKRPSAVPHDTRGPIPPANGIVCGSFTSSTAEPERAPKSEEGSEQVAVETKQMPEHVSKVVEDARGPIPNDEMAICSVPTPSEKRQVESVVGIGIYDIHTPNETGSEDTSSAGGSVVEDDEDERMGEATGPRGSYTSAKDPPGSYDASRGSRGSSLCGTKKESESAGLSKRSHSSDRKLPPPSLQNGLSKEGPHSPPQLRRMSSSSSFSSFDDGGEPHDAHTKPSLGFLSPSYAHHTDMQEIRTEATRMRAIVLEGMRRKQMVERRSHRPFQPIDI